MADPSIVSTSTFGGSAGANTVNVVLPKPASLADGDVLYAIAQFRTAGATVTLPSGWVADVTNGTNHSWVVAHKVIASAAGEPASYTFTTNGATSRAGGGCVAVRGLNPAAPTDVAGTPSTQGGTTSSVLPSVSPASTRALLLAFGAFVQQTSASVSSWAPDAAMTEDVDFIGGSAGTAASVGVHIAHQQLTAAGPTGTRTVTLSPAVTNNGGVLLALAPLGSTGGGTGDGSATTRYMDHEFSGPTSSAFAGDGFYSNLAGTAPTYVRLGAHGKGVAFVPGSQSIVEHAQSPSRQRIVHDRIHQLNGIPITTGEVLQIRAGAARGPGLGYTTSGKVRLVLSADGSNSVTGTTTVPIGSDYRVQLQLDADGQTCRAVLYANATATTPVETISGTWESVITETAVRDGHLSGVGLGAGIFLTASWPVDADGNPGPRVYPTYATEPPQANAGPDVAGLEPWNVRRLVGGYVQESNPVTARSWAQVANGAPTVQLVAVAGQPDAVEYEVPPTVNGVTLRFRYTVVASDATVSDLVDHTALPVPECLVTATGLVPLRTQVVVA